MDNNLNKTPPIGVSSVNNSNPANNPIPTPLNPIIPPIPNAVSPPVSPVVPQPSVVGVIPSANTEGPDGYVTEDKPKKINIKLISLIFLAILILTVGGYFAFVFLTKPTQIKEKLQYVHPIYSDYDKSIGKIIEDLKDESTGSDTDSMERALEKSKSLYKTASENKEQLETQLAEIKYSELKTYKTDIEEYLEKADEISNVEKDDIEISEIWMGPFKDFEDLKTESSGIGNYLLSDPDRYVTDMGAVAVKEEAILKKLNEISYDGEFKDMHRELIATYTAINNFRKEVVEGVKNRDFNKITDAEKNLEIKTQDTEKEVNRLKDKADERVEELNDDLNSERKNVEDEYNRLRNKYRL